MEVVSAAGQQLLDLTASLMSLERRPLEQVQATRGLVTSQLSAQRSLASKLSSLRRLSQDFAQLGALSPLRSFQVSGNGGGAFTATAGSTSTVGTHSVQVLEVAARHSLASGVLEAKGKSLSDATAIDRTFRFEVTAGGVATEISVELEPDADDESVLRAVADAIDRSTAGITASIVRVSDGERKLLIQAEDSGTAAQITSIRDIEGSLASRLGFGGGRNGKGELGGTVQAAADAHLIIDGLEVTSSKNQLDNVVDGISLQLTGRTSGTASIEVTRDPDAIIGEVRSLVDSYNAALDEIRTATRPSDDTGANRGILAANSSFRSLRTTLRSLFTAPIELESGNRIPSNIGLTADREGRISLNESKLRSLLQSDPEAVEEVLGGENGIGGRLATVLDSYSKVGGIVDQQISASERRRTLYDTRITNLTETLGLREESLFQQLAQMQAAIGSLQSQQSYLANFFTANYG